MIIAILKNKKDPTTWGYEFDTEIQSYVEIFMTKMHFGSNDYYLSFDHENPIGVYTKVKVKIKTGKSGHVHKIKFVI